jgi:hypothetical protein
MWQSLLIGLIVGCALAYVIWTLMPARLRTKLRVRLHLAQAPAAGEGSAAGGGSGELPCSNCAHNNAPHPRSHN